MKLYTINATPVRSLVQFNEIGYDVSGDFDLDGYNESMIQTYPSVVAKTLREVGIDGFTLTKVDGYWQGIPEVSFKIEIAIDPKKAHTINKVAGELRDMYQQDSVMVTYPDGYVEFL